MNDETKRMELIKFLWLQPHLDCKCIVGRMNSRQGCVNKNTEPIISKMQDLYFEFPCIITWHMGAWK